MPLPSYTNLLTDEAWLRIHEADLKKPLPINWVKPNSTLLLRMGWNLKLLGIEWRSDEELIKLMVYLEQIGIIQRQNLEEIRANPESIFSPTMGVRP